VDLVESLEEVPTGPDLTARVISHLGRAGVGEPAAWVLPWPVAAALGVAGLLLTAGIIVGALFVQAGLPGPVTAVAGSLTSAAASVGDRGLAALTVAVAGLLSAFAWPLFVILVVDVGLLIVLVTVGRRLAAGRSLGLGALGAV